MGYAGPEIFTDTELVYAARRHEPWAERALWERYIGRVTRLASRLLKSSADVEDLVQDVFLAAFMGLDRLERPAAFGTWIYEVTQRLGWKSQRRRREPHLDIDEFEVTNDLYVTRPAPPDVTADLRRAFDTLNAIPRGVLQIFRLRYVDGLTIPEIAESVRLSSATVKRRLAQAERRLARLRGG